MSWTSFHHSVPCRTFVLYVSTNQVALKCDKTISNVPASYAGGLCGRWIFAEVISYSSSRKIKNVNVCVPENLQTGISEELFSSLFCNVWKQKSNLVKEF